MRYNIAPKDDSPVPALLLLLAGALYVGRKLYLGQYHEVIGLGMVLLVVLLMVLMLSVMMDHGRAV